MGKAIGIDLGTTNSVMSIKQGQDIRVLQNRENEDLTPSIVGSYKGKLIVGGPAVDYMGSAREDTIISVKRLMGRAESDKVVQEVKHKYPYKIVPPSDGTPDDVRVILAGREYSPIKISSMILKKLKEDAEKRLNDTVDQAIITVPAYFTEKQKDATRKAGQLAGLKVQKILDEPTAAAIAFGVDNVGFDDTKTVLVYDLGGGTFDVSVLTIAGGIFAKLNAEGDMWLGGDDFDHKIMDYVLAHINKEYGIDAGNDPGFMLELRKHAEKAKKALSSMSSTDIVMIGKLKDGEGNLLDVEVELTRDQFEVMISAKVKDSIELVKTAIANAHLTMDQIDHVLMVGGSSTIPMIRRALSDLFGEKKVLMNIDPMRCVAYGAGILATHLVDSIECPKCQTINPGSAAVCVNETCKEPLGGNIIYDVTGMDLGIQTEGDIFKRIIEKGSPYPTPEPVVRTFQTPVSNMRRIKVPVYAGQHDIASMNELQVIVWLELPENVPADTAVDVSFKLDSDGILENVKVSLKDGSGREVEVYPDRGGSKRSQVEKKIEELKKKWDEKRADADEEGNQKLEVMYSEAIKAANANNVDAAERRIQEMEKEVGRLGGETSPEWKQKADGLMGYANFLLEQYGWLLDPQQSYKIKGLVDELKNAVEKDDEELGLKKWEELNKETDSIPEVVRILMWIVNGIMRAHSLNRLVEADKLRNLLREIEDGIKKNNGDTVKTKIDEAMAILVELLGADARHVSSGPINVELLK